MIRNVWTREALYVWEFIKIHCHAASIRIGLPSAERSRPP